MPYIKVDTSKITAFESTVTQSNSRVRNVSSSFSNIARNLDWDIKDTSSIDRQIRQVEQELDKEIASLKKMQTFFSYAKKKYAEVDKQEIRNNKAVSTTTVNDVVLNLLKVNPAYLLTLKNNNTEITNSIDVQDDDSDSVSRVYDFLSNALDIINKKAKDDDLTISSGLVKYINSLYKFVTGSYEDGWDVTSGVLSMIKSSAK